MAAWPTILSVVSSMLISIALSRLAALMVHSPFGYVLAVLVLLCVPPLPAFALVALLFGISPLLLVAYASTIFSWALWLWYAARV